jgi:tetratricopeptide (TPR) repeat protein
MGNVQMWFEDAKTKLKIEMQEYGNVDGARFLTEYLSVNWPEELDESIDEEQFEVYVGENLDRFELWLQKTSTDIEIHDDYIWGATRTISQESNGEIFQVINKAQELLLKKEFKSLEKADFPELCNVRNLLVAKNELNKALKAALMAAKIGDDNTEINDSERVQAWSIAGDVSMELDNVKDASLYYKKAGDIEQSCGDLLASAVYYENAACCYPDTDWRERYKLFRKARVLYADAGVNENASYLYIKESNLKVENTKGWRKFTGKAYGGLSKYGESPWRVLFWIALLICLCAVLYWCVDINTPESSIYRCNGSAENTSYICNEMGSGQVGPFAYLYFSVVTFTTLGYGDFSPTEGLARTIAGFQAFLGLMLSSLFIATFLRKFSR